MTRFTVLLLLLFFVTPAGAVLRQSGGDGRWQSIPWSPAGLPVAGDSLVIRHAVEGLAPGLFPMVRVEAGAVLRIDARSAVDIALLLNDGTIEPGAGSVVRVTSELSNHGDIAGEGLTMLMAPARVTGGGSIGHLLVGGAPAAPVFFEASTRLRTLTIERGNSVEIGTSDLTVDGAYYSRSPWGEAGIRATSGTIRLNGTVRGTACGTVVLGTSPAAAGSKVPPTIDGVIGDTGRSVTVNGMFDVLFSTFIGDLVIGPQAHLRGTGIGSQGRNRIFGDLLLSGAISTVEPTHTWEIHGNIINRGAIRSGTITLVGDSLLLDNVSGVWSPDVRLGFRGRTNGVLSIVGELTLSRLDIGAATGGDSNIVIDAGRFPLRIRHLFTSDIGRACELRSDTIVQLRGGANGSIDADVCFEGFLGREIAGRFGGATREVRITVSRSITATAEFLGELVLERRGALAVTGAMSVTGHGSFNGPVTLDTAGVLLASGRLELPWIVRGGGRIVLAGGIDTLVVSGAIADSITVEVGTDSTVSSLFSAHAVRLPALWVHAGSRITAGELEPISAGEDFRYDIVHPAGWHRASAAATPIDPRPRHYFGNATSSIFRFDGTGYQVADSIRSGEGVWMNVPVETRIAHRGGITPRQLMIPVHEEWNLIGPGSFHARTDAITCRGCTIVSGFFDTANNIVTTLEPGQGYWVRVSGNGTMTIGE